MISINILRKNVHMILTLIVLKLLFYVFVNCETKKI